jgi:hypothetical protein
MPTASIFGDKNSPAIYRSRLIEITQDGSVKLDNGQCVKLAGLTMRPVSETLEKDGLSIMAKIVNHRKRKVTVRLFKHENIAVVYYEQSLRYHIRYGPNAILCLFNDHEIGTVNELLIYTGLATYDPIADRLDAEMDDRLFRAQHSYYGAVHRGYYRTPLEKCAERPTRLYDERGYQDNLCQGDTNASEEVKLKCESWFRNNKERYYSTMRFGRLPAIPLHNSPAPSKSQSR